MILIVNKNQIKFNNLINWEEVLISIQILFKQKKPDSLEKEIKIIINEWIKFEIYLNLNKDIK